MASSGKKGKKSKGKTLALTDFLQETPGPAPSVPIRKTALNWADEVEDVYDNYDPRPKTNVVLPTAPKAARGLDDYSDKIPQNAPYIAYLSNLPYDVDEDEIAEFFGTLKISSMRIPKDDRPGEGPKLKGFGYVEFEDRDSLLGALAIPDCTLKNRRIRIEVATNSENDRRRGGRMDVGRDRGERSETSMGDWRSGPRSDPVESERRPTGGFNRDRERDGGPPATERDRPGAWRDNSERPSFRDDKDRFNRDGDRRGFDRDGDRRGFDRDGDRRGFDRDGDRRGFDRDGDRRGFDRDGDRRTFDRDGERRPFGGRRDDRNGGFARGGRDDEKSAEQRQRPKLNLMPRSRPVEEVSVPSLERETETVRPVSTPVPAASIFGSARPVDTSARERQIEERLAKENVRPDGPPKDERRRDDREDRRRADDPSPRRRSPEGRKYSPRRGSPDRRRASPDKRGSPEPRRGSPERRRPSPERRRPSPERRRASPDIRRSSPERKRVSPDRRRGSQDRRRGSSDRKRGSPEGRRGSSDRKKNSPDRWRNSPERKRSPEGGRSSPPGRRGSSPQQRRKSPERKIVSPDRRIVSTDRNKISEQKRSSPDRGKGPARKNDDREKKSSKIEKPVRDKDKPRRDRAEREMPKLKEPEAPNFVGINKFAYLSADDSD